MPLSRDHIVRTAVNLLDEHGVAGLTMRRLASALEVTATALYWHVKTKDDVLDLAVDEVFGGVRLPAVTSDWRADVRGLIHGWRAAMQQHPWSATLIGRPAIGPNVRERTAFLQDTLARGGLAGRDLEVATRLLANYVIGAAVTESAGRRTATDDDLFVRGLDLLLDDHA